MTFMGRVVRTWPALCSWGAGLLNLALAGSIGAGRRDGASLVVLAALVLIGLGELAWGCASLRAGRGVAPRTTIAGALAGVALAGAAIAVGCSAIAAGGAVALTAVGAVLSTRRRRAGATVGSRAGSTTAGLVVGAVLVAALVTPALSTTDAGAHSTHFPAIGHDPHAGH